MKKILPLFLILLALSACTGQAPAPVTGAPIIVDLQNPTYEQILDYGGIVVATYDGAELTLVDLLVYLVQEYHGEYDPRETDLKRCQDALHNAELHWRDYLIAREAGWDGSLSARAQAAYAEEEASIDRRLTSLSSDPTEARRLYAERNFMDADQYKNMLRRQIGTADYLTYGRPLTEEEIRLYYEEVFVREAKYAAYYVSLLKSSGPERLEAVLAYLDAGGFLGDYEDLPVHLMTVTGFDAAYYDWISWAGRGEYQWFEPERSLYYRVLQSLGTDYADLHDYIARLVREDKTIKDMDRLYIWEEREDILARIQVRQ
ncbi:MAG: hypothetical protein LBS10_01740 [Gracilibacteraceae bacterium]|jgi:hypothetical protein|nr:hypothetical protein [Gracilibacteraceae bacterium]